MTTSALTYLARSRKVPPKRQVMGASGAKGPPRTKMVVCAAMEPREGKMRATARSGAYSKPMPRSAAKGPAGAASFTTTRTLTWPAAVTGEASRSSCVAL